MSIHEAIGVIETQGLVACIQAADAMIKAAGVNLIAYENNGSGLVAVVINGDVAAVKVAVDVGVGAVKKIGGVVVLHLVIPSPHKGIKNILSQYLL